MNTPKIRILLYQKRKMRNMNQENVADLLHVTKQTYSDIENGKTQKINPTHKKILMDTFQLNEEELEQREYLHYINQVSSNYVVDSENVTTINTELIELLKNEQKKNGELQEKVVEMSKMAIEQSSVLSKLIEKYFERVKS